MKCPICNVDLNMTDRQGIEIDYCPQCRGVWLDRGELDKLIEKSQNPMERPGVFHEQRPMQQKYQEKNDHYYHKKHKRDSFLGEIFDF